MPIILHAAAPQEYLKCTSIIDYNHPDVASTALQLANAANTRLALIKKTYEFVRDTISHSADIKATTVTCKASEVLHAKEGLCYAKAHLLAALLRFNAIPTGFCYQLLCSTATATAPLVLHGLNAVYIEEYHTWIRLDARGNKPGINAQFSLDFEQLAYTIAPEKGEKEYSTVFIQPDHAVVHCLTTHISHETLWKNLPQQLAHKQ